MVYGDRKKYLVALITLEAANVVSWAKRNGVAASDGHDLTTAPRVIELITEAVDEVNRQLASFETVKRFHILPGDFSVEGGQLTPTSKLRRKRITEQHRESLDALYEADPPQPTPCQ